MKNMTHIRKKYEKFTKTIANVGNMSYLCIVEREKENNI